MRFSAIFFRMDCSFRRTTQFSFSLLDGATIFAKLHSKILKSPKISRKVCAHHFVQVTESLRDLKKIPTQQFRAENVDVHLYKKISACHYIALRANFVQVGQKRLKMNKFVRTKSHTGSKFSKMSLGLLCTRGIVVVHLYCGFFLRRQMAPQQTTKFRTAFLVNFVPV